LKHIVRKFAASALTGIVVTGCSAGSQHAASIGTPTPTTGSSVISRASSPAQTNAPGIQFTPGMVLSVSLNNHTIQITAQEWNTITDTSIVPHDIDVSIDSDFNAGQTTRNRFQYLADRMVPFIQHSLSTVGILSVARNRTDITIAALVNPTNDGYQLTGLKERITQSPPETPVAAAKFYTTPTTALTIPGHSIYFVRLLAPVIAAPPPNPTTEAFNFGWDKSYDCGQAACP
jgi:hypothetical protein